MATPSQHQQQQQQQLSQSHYHSSPDKHSTNSATAGSSNNMFATVSNFNSKGGGANSAGDGGSRIKVAVRIRPLLEHEKTQGHECSRVKAQGNNEVILQGDEQNRQKAFRFDQVFHQNTTQQDVYQGLGISNLVTKVIEGYHGTIFAYGQTGSGKTFTMEGYDQASPGQTQSNFNSKQKPSKPSSNLKDHENIGITQRCINELFTKLNELNRKERTSQRHFQVFCSFLQIYNEKVFDLLNQSSLTMIGNKKLANAEQVQKQQQGLRIRWTKKDQFVVENLYVFECQSAQEALELFKLGSKNRILAAHNLNDMSSRSHTVFCLTIESQDIAHQEMVTVSKLQLVDLAGSEKQGLTGTTGQQAKESIDINKSLLVLRKVITALTEQKQIGGGMGGGPGGGGIGSGSESNNKLNFIPYRESKLTCLLKQSLGGNSYTLMIACLSPSDRYLDENLSTLNYAARASLISNVPTKNIDPRIMEIDEQKRKIHDLERELRSANQHIGFLNQINEERARRIQALEQQLIRSQDGLNNQSEIGNYDSPTSKLPLIKGKSDNPTPTGTNNQPPVEQQPRSIATTGSNTIRNITSPGSSTTAAAALQVQQQMSQQKRTQLNFYLQQDKQKMDAASERLIHSVNAVTDLLKANTELRDTIEKMRRTKEDSDAEVFTLNIENQNLRERVELVEGILKNNRENYDQMVSEQVKSIMAKSNTQYGKFNMNATLESSNGFQSASNNGGGQDNIPIDKVYTELIQLRQQNRVLETRIKQLELQNFNITRSGGFGVKGVTSAGGIGTTPKNIEPSRPIFEKPRDTPARGEGATDEEEYDEEDDDEYDEEDHQQQHHHASKSFIVRLDQTHSPQQLVNIPPHTANATSQKGQHLKRNQGFGPHHHQSGSESHPSIMSPEMKGGAINSRKESQPVPDQRYYTKTNFFTINNSGAGGALDGGGNDQLSIADKYAHLHSQKMQRRPHHHHGGKQHPLDQHNSELLQSPNSEDQDHLQLHQRLQSFTDGGGSNKHMMMMGPPTPTSQGGAYDPEYFMQKNRMAKNKFVLKPIEEQQHQIAQAMGMGPSDFMGGVGNNDGILVKRKIKKKRIMQSQHPQQQQYEQMMPPLLHNQQQPIMMPQQQTNNNISMVMVMSNLMTKRTSGGNGGGKSTSRKKRTQSINNPMMAAAAGGAMRRQQQQQPNGAKQYQNPDFYF